MIDRERSVNVDNMSSEEVDVLSIQLGNKIKAICDEAVEKANAILNIYGANAKMMIEINQLPNKMAQSMSVETKPKKKRGRPTKNANLKQVTDSLKV